MPAQGSEHKSSKSFYHIYNVGVENRKLFIDEEDANVFLGYLEEYLTPPPEADKIKKTFSVNGRTFKGVPHQPKNYFRKIELVAYNLVPDHFHLLVCQLQEKSLEKFVRSISTRYAIYYNKKYKRRGSLFAGPYKSLKTKDEYEVLYLSRYLHSETNNIKSSYKEFLGIKESPWVKPAVVFDYLEKQKSDFYKGINGYKNFVENYEPNSNERTILNNITIDSNSEQPHVTKDIEVKKEDKNSDWVELDQDSSKKKLSVPGFLAASAVVFILLFGFGFNKVTSSSVVSTEKIALLPSPTSQVSGVKTETVSDFYATPTPQTNLVEEEKIIVKNVVVTLEDSSSTVNLRMNASTSSAIVGKASNGDVFQLVSEDQEWYRIQLEDGTAYLSKFFSRIEGDLENEN